MNKNIIFTITLIICLVGTTNIIAQNIGINTTGNMPDSSAMLDIAATDKGLLIPRMDSTSRMAIANPAHGLMVFDSTYNSFYFYDGASWNPVSRSASADNLGDHIATQDVQLNGHWLTNSSNGADSLQGIWVGPTGNVGIKIAPKNDFEVGVGKDIASSKVIDVLAAGSLNPGNSGWQSFTAPDYMHITDFAIYLFSGSNGSGWNYELVEGNGSVGNVLATGTSSTSNFTFNEILLKKDAVYTVHFSKLQNNTAVLNQSSSGSYFGGRSNVGPGYDFSFTVNAKVIRKGLSVSSSGVSFENYTFPTSDGTASQILRTDGSGNLTWESIALATALADADNNTKIQVEKTTNDDIIRFDINGTERWNMQNNTLAPTSNNLLIGQNAGIAFTSGQRNIGIGTNALRYHTTSADNVAIGYLALGHSNGNGGLNTAIGSEAGSHLTSGAFNTMMGYQAGFITNVGNRNVMIGMYTGRQINMSNSTLVGFSSGFSALSNVTAIGYEAGYYSGTGGVYLGYQAGKNEVDDNKLYIDNSSTSTPLIWGDFANDILKVHGTFNINDAYSFPTVDGGNGQVLVTDGTGGLAWTNQTVNTDNQQISLISDTITLTDGGAPLDLKPYLDNTDAQDLSLSGNSLSLTNDATPVDLSSYLDADDLGNHTATQNLRLNNRWLSNDGGNEGISINNAGVVNVSSNLTVGGNTTVTGNATVSGILNTTNILTAGGGVFLNAGGWGMEFDIDNDANSNDEYRWRSDNVQVMSLNQNGNLVITGNGFKPTAGDWISSSDKRLKKNIQPLSSENMLHKLLALKGVTYEWNDTITDMSAHRPEGIQYGFTAQNIQEVFPSLIKEDDFGYLQTSYGTYDAMTVEAIRALNDKIEQLQEENSALKAQLKEVSELKSSVAELKAMLGKTPSLSSDQIEVTVK